jgi:hypothetical protein
LSAASLIPFISGTYGVGGSGMLIKSVATGDTITINAGFGFSSNNGFYRVIMVEMIGPTTLRVFIQGSGSLSATDIWTYLATPTVGANFMNNGVLIQDYIGDAYSGSSDTHYYAQTNLSGTLYKF